jgi:hypothetical protein
MAPVVSHGGARGRPAFDSAHCSDRAPGRKRSGLDHLVACNCKEALMASRAERSMRPGGGSSCF